MLFFASLDCDKELCMSFSLLTKACQLPVVQSTTTSITTCALWHCLHTVPHSLAVVPIRKLLRYSRCQSRGDAHHHLVGSHPQHHMYHIILRKCGHITHDPSLADISSQSCSTVLYPVQSSQCTTIQYTPLTYFETKSSRRLYQHA